MPFLRLQTNTAVADTRQEEFLAEASRLVSASLGKNEKFFMGSIEPGRSMSFGGSRAPLAFLQLKALELPPAKTAELSAELSALVHDQLGIPPDRVYVEFDNVARGMWGWNGDVL